MPTFLEVDCADAYPAEDANHGPALAAVYQSPGGYFLVEGNDAICTLQYGDVGQESWTEDKLAPVGVGYLAPGTIGARFRNRISGQVATVSASLGLPGEPPLSLGASGAASASGSPLLAQAVLSADFLVNSPAMQFVFGTSQVTFDGSTVIRIEVALAEMVATAAIVNPKMQIRRFPPPPGISVANYSIDPFGSVNQQRPGVLVAYGTPPAGSYAYNLWASADSSSYNIVAAAGGWITVSKA